MRRVALDEQHVGGVDGAGGGAHRLEVGRVGGGDEVLERAGQIAALLVDVGERRVRAADARRGDERVQELGLGLGVGARLQEQLAARRS